MRLADRFPDEDEDENENENEETLVVGAVVLPRTERFGRSREIGEIEEIEEIGERTWFFVTKRMVIETSSTRSHRRRALARSRSNETNKMTNGGGRGARWELSKPTSRSADRRVAARPWHSSRGNRRIVRKLEKAASKELAKVVEEITMKR